ncbi:APC family permease [Streptomyces katrae]|uniref:APC family permease n=1 Tax=Streptomyces katrae TaxID=68223 RepID=A0ABT7GUY2_9ACTN|nr:APC family permease [Streptomyces katrae]MDK9497407.1 APC family permease [Streptomyces katrae]
MGRRAGNGGGGELRGGVFGTFDAVVMAVGGCGPAYTLAATIPVLVATVGLAGPAVLLYCALPTIGIALAFRHLGRLDVNAGASYAWVARALHPFLGFLSGWALVVSATVFLVAATRPAGSAVLALVVPALAGRAGLATAVGAGLFVLMAVVVALGARIGPYARRIITGAQLALLLAFAVAALATDGHRTPFSLSWFGFGHFDAEHGFVAGALVAGVMYAGWDVESNLNEETRGGRRAFGLGGLISVVVSFAVFSLFTVATVRLIGVDAVRKNPDGFLSELGEAVWPGWGGRLLVLAVVLSTVATLETALLQATRTLFAMGRDGTVPSVFGRIHREWGTPAVATGWMAGVALLVVAVAATAGSGEQFVRDAVSGIGLHIAFYYALAGLSAVVAYRKVLFRSAGNLLFVGLWPLAGALFMGWVFVVSLPELTGSALAVGLGALALGLVPMGAAWLRDLPYFSPRPLDPGQPAVGGELHAAAHAGRRRDGVLSDF